MKQTYRRIKNHVSQNPAETAVTIVAVPLFAALLVLAFKQEAARQVAINAAVASGKSVLDTPWGTIIF